MSTCYLFFFVLLWSGSVVEAWTTHSNIIRSKLKLSSTRRPATTRRLAISAKSDSWDLIVGVNKYSHDAACCIIDGKTGDILFTQAKERLTGRKHDGGAIGNLIQYGLKTIPGATIDDIKLVVSNNHHFRIHPYEKRLPFYEKLGCIPYSKENTWDYLSDHNLLPNAKHIELSHHLAHAWSGVATSSFKKGLVVVMDGMGESYQAMAEDIYGSESDSGEYVHDIKLIKQSAQAGRDMSKFVGKPSTLYPGSSYREAESAYLFDGKELIPLFKRWSRERSPSELFNHGFENMESLGAIYSRISSHVLGDWNACGKIMGLAPWANKQRLDVKDWIFSDDKKGAQENMKQLELGQNFYHKLNFMKGNPVDGSFVIDWDVIESLEHCNDWSDDKFGFYSNLASSVQSNLEDTAMSLLRSLQDMSKAATGGNIDSNDNNLVLTGGVALNSVLNGKIIKELDFTNVHIGPAPGDEGVAIGCAYFGYQQWLNVNPSSDEIESQGKSKKESQFSPYSGGSFDDIAIQDAMLELAPWIDVSEQFETDQELVEDAADALVRGEVIAWFQGKSEFGQRALGSRSILADPRDVEKRRFINQMVKEREWYRPLAPSVLDEKVGEWFDDIPSGRNLSPYMSITGTVSLDKQAVVPAVCHCDGSARLQTVTEAANALYHALISAFYKRTGVPMVLNTSFNRKSQPIIETPSQAIKSFLACQGSIDTLYMGQWAIRRKAFPLVSPSTEDSFDSQTSKFIFQETNSDELINKMSEVMIFGNPIYLTEVTTGKVSEKAMKIRVQDGGDDTGDDLGMSGANSRGASFSSAAEWKTLPGQLTLEILQLLQLDEGSGLDEGEAAADRPLDMSASISVLELWEAIRGVYEEDTRTVEPITLKGFLSTLRWLFDNQLISFDDGMEPEMNPDELFPTADIFDLRN